MESRLVSLLVKLNVHPVKITTVSGGDINDSYRVTTKDDRDYFVKMNRSGQSKDIITTEAHGLDWMKRAGVTILPENVRWVENGQDACLLMPFFKTVGQPRATDWEYFFEQMARMHLIANEFFGGSDNYIGLLPQDNSPKNNWVPFFRENRLRPQLEQARKNGYFDAKDEQTWNRLFENLPEIIPIERPSLIHGDLWNGNILPTGMGIILIDPCPYFGHREMDFAMMDLFSGIPVRHYLPVYHKVFPLQDGLYDRIELYQLYYLLVHLNLFGTAYLPGVQRIIKKFSE